MKDYSKFWDAVYVINLDFRQDRWESIQEKAEAIDLKIERWNAVKATDVNLEQDRVGIRVKKTSCVACALSHYGIYRDALAKGYDRILVLEDDADLPLDLYEQVDNMFNTNEYYLTNYDLIYLGCADKYPNVSLTENLLSILSP